MTGILPTMLGLVRLRYRGPSRCRKSAICELPSQVAVACIKVASQAVATMPSLLFWPLAPFLALCCLVVYWVAVAAFLYSASSIVPQQLQAPSSGPLSLSVSAYVLDFPYL